MEWDLLSDPADGNRVVGSVSGTIVERGPMNVYPARRPTVVAVGGWRSTWPWSDSPDLVAAEFGEPEVAVRPGGDARRRAAVGGWDGEHADNSRGRDPTDLVVAEFGEPEVAVRSGGDG